MSELLSHFHFLRPLWLLALGPAALAGWLLWRQQDPRRSYGAIIAPHLLAHLVIRAGKTRWLRPEVVLLGALPLSILALAGPSWRQEPSPFAEDHAAAMVVMKIAPSMQASDLQPSRLERAQHKLHDWLALRPGARAGLIAYSGSAHLVMPLTRDSRIVEQMAQALEPSVMPVQGEALADALKLAQQQIERAGVPGSIVVLTDSIAASQLSALASYRQAGAPPVQVLAMVGSRQAVTANGLDTGAHSLDASLELVSADDSDVRRLAARATTNVTAANAREPEARWRDEGYALVPLLTLVALLWARRGWSMRWHQPLEGNL
jgi:Ca-activated chloride channel family protein